jgi:hypothetical protein
MKFLRKKRLLLKILRVRMGLGGLEKRPLPPTTSFIYM